MRQSVNNLILERLYMKQRLMIGTLGIVVGLGVISRIDSKNTQAFASKSTSSQQKNENPRSLRVNDVLGNDQVTVDAKIGFVDAFQVMGECNQGKIARNDLEKKREELSKGIQEEEKKIQQKMTEYKSKATALSEDARVKEEKKLLKMEREYKETVEESQTELQRDMQSKTEILARDADQGIVKMAKAENLDVVFDKMTGRAVYVSEQFDFTQKAIEAVDQNYEIKLAESKKVQSNSSTKLVSNNVSGSTSGKKSS